MKFLCQLPVRHLLKHFTAGGLIAYCLLAITSCKPKTDYSGQITSLDSAQSVLTATREDLLSTPAPDSNAVVFLTKSIEDIRSHQSSDTVNKQTALLLAELSGLKGTLIDLKQYRGNYIRATEESLKRIDDLQHDLQENLIEDDNKAREYIVNETQSLKKIVTELKVIKEVSRITTGKMDSLKPKITMLTDSLKLK